MSAHQGSSACRITVDPSTADVLRIEAKKVLMFNHEPFEDFLDYVPAKQLALADVYRDATAVIDALGWDPDSQPQRESVEVPLTPGHIQQLHQPPLRPARHQPRPPDRHRRRPTRQRHRHGRDPRQPPRRRSAQPRLRRLRQHDHHVGRRTSVAGSDPATES